jgi:hypothetical protein
MGSNGAQFNKLKAYRRKFNIEVSVLVGYKTVSVGNQFPLFKKIQWSYLQGSDVLSRKCRGTNCPLMQVHISQEWKPQLHHCKTQKTAKHILRNQEKKKSIRAHSTATLYLLKNTRRRMFYTNINVRHYYL